MKDNNIKKTLKVKQKYLWMAIVLPLIVTTCRNKEKQYKLEKLDDEIAVLDSKIYKTMDVRTAPVPANLRATQARYKKNIDDLNNDADSVDLYIAYNDSLFARAYNNYAVRIGRDFQLSNFLSDNDITVFQKHIATLDTMDFMQENARQRILHNKGSLNDLSYFLEIIDFDSVNKVLINRLAWNFNLDTNINNTDCTVIPVLGFDTSCINGTNINNALVTEQNLLNLAWTNTSDSTQHNTVPEFDSVYKNKTFQHNDSIIRERDSALKRVIQTEDSLLNYEFTLRAQRDSLIRKRNELIK